MLLSARDAGETFNMPEMERIIENKGKRFLLRVESSPNDRDFRKYEDIRNEIWGFPEDHLAGTRNLICESFLHEGSSLFIGAFSEDRGAFPLDYDHLAGFSYGFVGIEDKAVGFRDPGNLRFYSQYAGVKRAFRSFGLGVSIKDFQRRVLLDIYGIKKVMCTFDPLTGVNAYRNIHHFCMEVLEYRVSVYPEFGGKLNRADIPSDRFLMLWELDKKPERPDYDLAPLLDESHKVIRTGVRPVSSGGAGESTDIALGFRAELDAPFLLVQVPRDFYRILSGTDVDDPDVRRIALDWRTVTREAFLSLLGRGYEIIDFRQTGDRVKEDFYVLQRHIAKGERS
jgi:predicted GNAT superfamily acetyltransferase